MRESAGAQTTHHQQGATELKTAVCGFLFGLWQNAGGAPTWPKPPGAERWKMNSPEPSPPQTPCHPAAGKNSPNVQTVEMTWIKLLIDVCQGSIIYLLLISKETNWMEQPEESRLPVICLATRHRAAAIGQRSVILTTELRLCFKLSLRGRLESRLIFDLFRMLWAGHNVEEPSLKSAWRCKTMGFQVGIISKCGCVTAQHEVPPETLQTDEASGYKHTGKKLFGVCWLLGAHCDIEN